MTSTNERLSISSMASAENSDIITCQTLLNSLGDQLQAQMDINSDYMLFQTQLERQKNHASKLLKNVSKNVESVEKKWNDFIVETLGVKNNFVKEIEKNSKFAHGSTESNNIQNVSEITQSVHQKHEDILENVAEIQDLTESIDSFHAKTRIDQRRLSLIETKIEEIQKLDSMIAKVLEREVKNAEKIKTASRNEERMYGIWELTSGYKQLLRHLGTTIDELEALTAQSNEIINPISTLSKEELNILTLLLKRLLEMLQAEISNNNFNNNNETSN